MTDDSSRAKDLLEATTALTKAVPVYPDLIQPAAIELGKGLETVAGAVNVALAPLAALVWGYERIQKWLESRLTKELEDVPPEDIVTPNPHVVGPAIEALRYAAGKETLREMFAKLIATSMQKEVAENAHPTFVEIIKQMSSDEAKIIPLFLGNTYHPFISLDIEKDGDGGRSLLPHWTNLALLAECDHPSFAPAYIENLRRLGLLELIDDAEVEDEAYQELLSYESIKDVMDDARSRESGVDILVRRGIVTRTMLGQMFMDACVGEAAGSQAKLIG